LSHDLLLLHGYGMKYLLTWGDRGLRNLLGPKKDVNG
jgi:hypothetical protein